MNGRWRTSAVLGGLLVAAMLAPLAQLGRVAAAQLATPVPGAQTWSILVNNISPSDQNWSFNAFYPDQLRAHPGDTIVFTLAPNPQALHAVHVLALGMTPTEYYQGFSGGFLQADKLRPGEWQRPFFMNEALSPCGREGQDPCLFTNILGDINLGLGAGALVNPPATGGDGNTSFTVTLDPALPIGPYYVTSDADGPTMNARIDVVAPDQPTQTSEEVEAAAQRQYQGDLLWLDGQDRVVGPAEASNPDGTKIWQVDAGGSGQNKPWLSINEFAPANMLILAGDTVTWTNHGPAAVPHTVTGFVGSPDALPQTLQNLNPYQAACLSTSGELQPPPTEGFALDVWNGCPGLEVYNLTGASQPSAPSGDPYVDGERTSGILLNADYIDSPIGEGIPFTSSYSVLFPNEGMYSFACAIHPNMVGSIRVLPKQMPQ